MSFEYKHEKCGATLVERAGPNAQVVPEDDCRVCAEVRGLWQTTGQLRASAGTPLFDELGGKVLLAKESGPTKLD